VSSSSNASGTELSRYIEIVGVGEQAVRRDLGEPAETGVAGEVALEQHVLESGVAHLPQRQVRVVGRVAAAHLVRAARGGRLDLERQSLTRRNDDGEEVAILGAARRIRDTHHSDGRRANRRRAGARIVTAEIHRGVSGRLLVRDDLDDLGAHAESSRALLELASNRLVGGVAGRLREQISLTLG
jgi:hypothetical protein